MTMKPRIVYVTAALSLLSGMAHLSQAAETPYWLPLASAKTIVDKAAAYAAKKNLKVSIAIVNREGNLIYFERGDNSFSGSAEAAIQKAKSSNAFQRPTSAFADAVNKGKTGLLSINDVVAVEGGVPIVLQGQHFGAIGVSGGKAIEDEEVANAGL